MYHNNTLALRPDSTREHLKKKKRELQGPLDPGRKDFGLRVRVCACAHIILAPPPPPPHENRGSNPDLYIDIKTSEFP